MAVKGHCRWKFVRRTGLEWSLKLLVDEPKCYTILRVTLIFGRIQEKIYRNILVTTVEMRNKYRSIWCPRESCKQSLEDSVRYAMLCPVVITRWGSRTGLWGGFIVLLCEKSLNTIVCYRKYCHLGGMALQPLWICPLLNSP